jgi:hypothetical protein
MFIKDLINLAENQEEVNTFPLLNIIIYNNNCIVIASSEINIENIDIKESFNGIYKEIESYDDNNEIKKELE